MTKYRAGIRHQIKASWIIDTKQTEQRSSLKHRMGFHFIRPTVSFLDLSWLSVTVIICLPIVVCVCACVLYCIHYRLDVSTEQSNKRVSAMHTYMAWLQASVLCVALCVIHTDEWKSVCK